MPYVEPEHLPWDGRRVPITFVGGYLGAGKTTAINDVLRVADRPIAVIVNDAGAVNVDAALIRRRHGDTIELTDGCICCTSIDEMGAAFDMIRARPEPPEHVVIELSGVAQPSNVVPWGDSAGFRLDGVVIVAAADQLLDNDAPTWIREHRDHQLAVADLVVLTKTDLVDADAVTAARRAVQRLAPGVPVIDAGRGRAADGALGRFLALGGHRREDAAAIDAPTLFDLHDTHVVSVSGPLLDQEVRALAASLPERFAPRRVVRAKGVIDAEGGRQVLVQVVGRRIEITELFEQERQRATDLVVITVAPD